MEGGREGGREREREAVEMRGCCAHHKTIKSRWHSAHLCSIFVCVLTVKSSCKRCLPTRAGLHGPCTGVYTNCKTMRCQCHTEPCQLNKKTMGSKSGATHAFVFLQVSSSRETCSPHEESCDLEGGVIRKSKPIRCRKLCYSGVWFQHRL